MMDDVPVKLIPLGGLGEIGQNMMVVEYDREIVVIDAGILFVGSDTPGIDFAIPDISYLIKNRDRLRAILITHGHEDHIGALPFVLRELDVPVYASRLTHGLISVKLKEHGLLKSARLNVVEPHESFKIGPFRVEFFRVCHSIPDAMGICLTTPSGKLIHTGDFKIDHTPADGRSSDLSYLSQLTDGGVLALCSDSTYAEVRGYTESEEVVGRALDIAISDAKERVIVATFASLISRIQQVIDAAVRHGRHVTVVGRSMNNNVKMAMNLGYLNVPTGTIVSMEESRKLPKDELIIVATGSQGEPTSALVRMANGEHRDVGISAGDTIIISASPIPGNETVVAKTIDNLMRQGAKVLHSRIALVHVHGHASQEELKTMISIVNPKYLVPIHGEYRHLTSHAELGQAMGIPSSNTFVLEDGDVLELSEKDGRVTEQVHAGSVLVDGKKLLDIGSPIIEERKRLSRDGVVVVAVSVEEGSGKPVGFPEILSSGFGDLEETDELFENTAKMVLTRLDEESLAHLELEQLRALVSESVSRFLYKQARMRPKVFTVIEQI